MRRILAGLTALLLVVSTVGLEQSEGCRRRHCRRKCCPPAPVCCFTMMCLDDTIECPQTLTGSSSSGGTTYYTYSGDKCSCVSTSCSNDNISTSISYSKNLGSDPNLHCTDYSCVSGRWYSSNDPNHYCIISPVTFSSDVGQVPEEHVGRTGIADYADAGTKFTPAQNFTVTTIPNFAFRKGATPRQAVVFVIYDAQGEQPLFAVGFELKDAPAEGTRGVPTVQPNSARPYLYEASMRAENKKTGKIDTVNLRIYTRQAR